MNGSIRLYKLEWKLLQSWTMRLRRYLGLICFVAVFLDEASACSTLCLQSAGRIIFGKNYDWTFEDGMLIVNKRGVQRVSDTGKIPARWNSKYGSVTFNQYGRNFPSGGINEAGLVVELMWAAGSRYPEEDLRPTVGCLEWIQYQLDSAGTVSDVLSSDPKIRIQSKVPLHYLIADRSGNVAAIEFISGKMVAHTGKNLPVPVLTNDLYEDSLHQLEKSKHWVPTDAGSRARFIRAANRVKSYQSGDPVSYVFDSLADVHSQLTQWSIVYEIDSGMIHFRTKSNPQIRTLELKTLDFSCGSSVLILNLKEGIQGDAGAQLHKYTVEANLDLIRSSFSQTDFLAKVSSTELRRIAFLPEQGACKEQ